MITSRPKTLRSRVKPIASAIISNICLAYYRLRYRRKAVFGVNITVNHKLVIKGPGRVIFGDNINAWAHAEKNVFVTYRPETVIRVGSGTKINGVGVFSYAGVTFGERCLFGSAIVMDSDFHPLHPRDRHNPDVPFVSRPVKLGNDVWVAGQAVVLKGVTIGDNSVVAYRAVVTGDVPRNVVVGGNPARIIREHPEWDEK